mgnify:CR=1 FL=1
MRSLRGCPSVRPCFANRPPARPLGEDSVVRMPSSGGSAALLNQPLENHPRLAQKTKQKFKILLPLRWAAADTLGDILDSAPMPSSSRPWIPLPNVRSVLPSTPDAGSGDPTLLSQSLSCWKKPQQRVSFEFFAAVMKGRSSAVLSELEPP